MGAVSRSGGRHVSVSHAKRFRALLGRQVPVPASKLTFAELGSERLADVRAKTLFKLSQSLHSRASRFMISWDGVDSRREDPDPRSRVVAVHLNAVIGSSLSCAPESTWRAHGPRRT